MHPDSGVSLSACQQMLQSREFRESGVSACCVLWLSRSSRIHHIIPEIVRRVLALSGSDFWQAPEAMGGQSCLGTEDDVHCSSTSNLHCGVVVRVPNMELDVGVHCSRPDCRQLGAPYSFLPSRQELTLLCGSSQTFCP